MKPIWIILISIFSTIVLFILATSIVGFFIAFYNKESNKIKDPLKYNIKFVTPELQSYTEELLLNLSKETYEKVETKSHDGLTLRGNLYEFNKDNPIMIFFHGYKSSLYSDCCGAYWLAKEAGFNVLLVSERGHCFSDGNIVTFGIKEKYDVLTWINFAIARYGKDVSILLGGVSMGSSTICMATSLNLPKNVKCLACDCGYSDAKEEIKLTIKKMKLPVAIFYPCVYLGALLFAHVNLNSVQAKDALKNNEIPVMFVHGDADQTVPLSMAKDNYNANKGKKALHIFSGAGHGISYLVDTPRYHKELMNFIKDIDFSKESNK